MSKFILSFLLSFGFGVETYAQNERFAFQDTLNGKGIQKGFLFYKYDRFGNFIKTSYWGGF